MRLGAAGGRNTHTHVPTPKSRHALCAFFLNIVCVLMRISCISSPCRSELDDMNLLDHIPSSQYTPASGKTCLVPSACGLKECKGDRYELRFVCASILSVSLTLSLS